VKIWFAAYATALASLLVLDGLWLGVIARNFYKARIGDLLLDKPNFAIAAVFYLVHAAGIVVFAIPQATTWTTALLFGALFGFFVYAAYDLTNLATLRGWPASVAVIDLMWGSAATAVATTVAFLVLRRIA
jgi:uncharacterized membrane protein